MRSPVEKWMKQLPKSRMTYPAALYDRVKYLLWRLYTPFHPYVRDTSTALGIVKHEGRQDYLIGKIDPARSVEELVAYLVAEGFGNHFIAWKDTDELISLRRTEGFKYQYHVRVFTDGEVRCHYEYTPEYSPILHLLQVGFEDRAAEFKKLLEGWVLPHDSTEKEG